MESAEGGVQFDMSNLTVSDIRQLDNPVLRDVLLKVKEQIEAESSGSWDMMQHGNHSDFNSSIS